MSKTHEALKLALEALLAATPVKAKDPQMQADAIVAIRSVMAKQPAQQEPKKDLMYSTVATQERHAAFVDRAVATLEQAKREALADSALDKMAENARELGLDYEPDVVLPGGGHTPAVPVAVYGYCPECGGAGVMRERRPNGDDKCTNGHKYPSSKALAEQPAHCEAGPEHCPVCLAEQPARQQKPYGYKSLECDRFQFDEPEIGRWVRVYTSPPAQQPDMNLNCKSVQSRLATSWGYVKAEQPVQQQEPIAWIERDMNCDEFDPDSITYQKPDTAADGWEWVPLYTSPPASKPWVGLTTAEFDEIHERSETLHDAMWETMAKLREKNA